MHQRALLASSLVLPVLLFGCSPATKITATPWQASPDGEWVARVARYDTVGPGLDDLHEIVELRRRTADKGADLFSVDEGGVPPDELKGPPVITLHWRDRTHLEIDYRAGKIDHQVVKVAGLTIETRKLAV